MTEAEWLACTNPMPMLEFLAGKTSDRKLRLFAAACCRRIWNLLDQIGKQAVQCSEQYADGNVTGDERAKIENLAWWGADGLSYEDDSIWFAGWAAHRVVEGNAIEASALVTEAIGDKTDLEYQCQLLGDIFGNPFHPLLPRPEAIAPLAEQIYAGNWDLMPLLGEWLQEHGYWQEGEHCLDPKNQHVKGCWVVDWVTGRE